MLIAQITDIHLGFERDNPGEMNRLRLDATLARLTSLDPRPDLLLCTGDLTDRGDQGSYERLRDALATCPIPWLLAAGNHDLRGPMLSVFPQTRTWNGFVQYVVDDWPLRIIVLDSAEERRHAGAFGPDRAAWLQDRLAEAPNKPTLLVMHHPPVITGIDWMTLVPDETWAPRLTAVVSRHKQVVGAICGHMHRAITAPWAGTTLRVCPSTAPQVTLDLRPMDLDHPDNRPLIEEEPPAYALHRWTPAGLLTFYARVETPEVLLRFDSGFQPVLKHFEEERHQEPKYASEAGAVEAGLAHKLFGFGGRLRRRDFWVANLALGVTAMVISLLLGMAFPALLEPVRISPFGMGFTLTWALIAAQLVVLWPFLAVSAKRLHDRNRSAGWLLFLLVPFVGALFWLIDEGLMPGTRGPNRFGADPK